MPADPQEVFQTDSPAGTSMIVVFVPKPFIGHSAASAGKRIKARWVS